MDDIGGHRLSALLKRWILGTPQGSFTPDHLQSYLEEYTILDLFLSYRAVKGWSEMVALVDKMSQPLTATVMVQEQFALALNREGEGEKAEEVLF